MFADCATAEGYRHRHLAERLQKNENVIEKYKKKLDESTSLRRDYKVQYLPLPDPFLLRILVLTMGIAVRRGKQSNEGNDLVARVTAEKV